LAVVAEILLMHDRLELTAPCHGRRWTASADEMQQIREYMGAALTGTVELKSRSAKDRS
jgi:hypothetical protein